MKCGANEVFAKALLQASIWASSFSSSERMQAQSSSPLMGGIPDFPGQTASGAETPRGNPPQRMTRNCRMRCLAVTGRVLGELRAR